MRERKRNKAMYVYIGEKKHHYHRRGRGRRKIGAGPNRERRRVTKRKYPGWNRQADNPRSQGRVRSAVEQSPTQRNQVPTRHAPPHAPVYTIIKMGKQKISRNIERGRRGKKKERGMGFSNLNILKVTKEEYRKTNYVEKRVIKKQNRRVGED